MKTKNLVCIFCGLLACILLSSCGGENKAIKTAKSLVFFPNTYEAGYQLGDVVDTTLNNVHWEAKKIDGEWYVTLSGNFISVDDWPEAMKRKYHVGRKYSNITQYIYSFDFLIEGNNGRIYSGGVSYDGKYSASDDSDTAANFQLLYLLHDYIIKNEN